MVANSSHAGSRSPITALVWPLPEHEVLVEGEKVYYRARMHWASLASSLLETFAVYVLLLTAFEGFPTTFGTLAIFLVLASVVIVGRLAQTHVWTWSEGTLLAVLVMVAVSATADFPTAIGGIIAIAAAVRLVAHYLRWGFYELRYVTNRRIIETSGFFGSRISSMPLGRVTDISLTRSVVGEVLDYGTLRVESAGQDQALGKIPFLVEPEMFHETIVLLSTETHG